MYGYDEFGNLQDMTGSFTYGGDTLVIAQTVMKHLLVFVAAALFVSACVLIVRQFVGDGDDVSSMSQMLKRACGMLATVFVIIFLALAGTSLGKDFISSQNTVEKMNSMVNANDKDAQVVITHHGDKTDNWSDGQSKKYNDLNDGGTEEEDS